jgi:transposase-like protein
MRGKRRKHSAEFKARIAVEAIKGAKTVQQIAAENNLHPVQVTEWKTQMLESAVGVFARGRDQTAEQENLEKEKERLERKVGQLVVEVDWLQKKCRELGIDP